ncbi:MAG: succinylglutamate desuccinylase/aspartoacylase family protein [Actinomycetota bacterium]
MSRRAAFSIGDLTVRAGRTAIGELPVARLVTGTQVSLPLRVVHGATDGPTVWLSAAVHGDEIAGVEVIRRAVDALVPKHLAGTVIAVPIVNPHGFLSGDRYLPDRRDLNRSFPGSPRGSLAGRIAHLVTTEIVDRCDVGIDLHTGSDHRTNLPQVRADLDDPRTRSLALAFGAPVALHAQLRDGSLRATAVARGARMLLFEGGEAWRFDPIAIDVAVAGIARTLAALGMTEPFTGPPTTPTIECRGSRWVRARRTGICLLDAAPGETVEAGAPLATIRDALGRVVARVKAPESGIVIGQTQHPLVNQGDAIVHLATPNHSDPRSETIQSDPLSSEVSP